MEPLDRTPGFFPSNVRRGLKPRTLNTAMRSAINLHCIVINMPEEKKKGKNITKQELHPSCSWKKKVIDTTPSNAARKQEIIQVTRLPLSRYHYIEKNAFAKVFCTKLIPNPKQ